jgi:hypothetical protein
LGDADFHLEYFSFIALAVLIAAIGIATIGAIAIHAFGARALTLLSVYIWCID